jgi:hypothetical protein
MVFFLQISAMKNPSKRILAFIFAGFFGVTVHAQNLDVIGVTLLRTVTTNLDGAGIRVAQPEAYNGDNGSTNSWEVNPANVAQPVVLFTYTSGLGASTSYPNSVGDWSSHADAVGNNFYGLPNGVATNVAHVDNYDANYFVKVEDFVVGSSTNYIVSLPAANINDRVVNQSFISGHVPSQVPVAEQQAIDSAYDNYAAQYKTLFVSGAGNSGPVCPPSTCYNGISVGAYGGGSSAGPTVDNGRAKPDITIGGVPANLTSFSTPFVSGAAAVLMQAGLRGDGGGDTNSAADIRTVKALLLNGAIKPADWMNNPPSPLDTLYGAGVLNAFNSYEQLAGGKHGYIFSTNIPAGAGHPPVGATGTAGGLSGWDFNTNSSSSTTDGVNHYYFNVTNGAGNTTFTVTATLVWNRHRFQKGINNLDLFLYDAVSSNLVACSTSLVDNVEHIFVPKLAQGRYDLQVWKAGGSGIVSSSETYALAWEFFSTSLNVSKSGTNISISWPVYPDGFVLQTATNLVSPVAWSANNPAPAVTNNQNVVLLNATNANQFFRLQRP